MPDQDFRRRDGLHRLAEAHFVADQGAPGTHGEQCAFGLVRIERHLEQLLQRGRRPSLRKLPVEHPGTPRRIVSAGDEIERVVMGAQFVPGLRHPGEKAPEIVETVLRQMPSPRLVEQSGGRFGYLCRTIRAGAKMDRSPSLVSQIQLRECGLITTGEGRLCASLAQQSRQGKFNVLAGAEFVGGVIGTVAKVVARAGPTNRHAIAEVRLRIADAEFGEIRLRPEILQRERLLLPELPTQGALPVGGRHVIGGVDAGKLRGST
ncbi:hypothetical protein [Paraburkholderia sp. Clong3]|uniref:hypothetical protein n=1 Tax=Paraburkholderia sp. Clong3 TaxID=2991061 RepID=UPI003D1E9AF6